MRVPRITGSPPRTSGLETTTSAARSSACHRIAKRRSAPLQPAFAIEAGCAVPHTWLAQGFGYEITGAVVWMAYSSVTKAAETLGCAPEIKERIRRIADSRDSFVTEILGREVALAR